MNPKEYLSSATAKGRKNWKLPSCLIDDESAQTLFFMKTADALAKGCGSKREGLVA